MENILVERLGFDFEYPDSKAVCLFVCFHSIILLFIAHSSPITIYL